MATSDGKSGIKPRNWRDLDADEQLRLRVEYGRYLDRLPPTCSLTEKNERFRHWLKDLGIEFDGM